MTVFGFDILSLFQPLNLFLCFAGVFIGLLVGAMPGLGTTLAIALVLPFTYKLNPLTAILLLLCVYQGAEYGGSISAIILGIPGTAGAAATCLDGNILAKAGRPSEALRYSLTASTIGGLFGAFVMLFFTRPVGVFALRFSAPDYCMLGLLACIAVISMSKGNYIKGLVSIILGLLLSLVGTDVINGAVRFNFGQPELYDGLDTVCLIVAVFAIPELLCVICDDLNIRYAVSSQKSKANITIKDHIKNLPTMLSGSIIGTIVGIFPGLGGGVAAWMSYMFTSRTAKKPETFGKGNPKGIYAPESANNASVAGSMIPMLSMGIPGSSAAALIGAAFTMQGIQVGPMLFNTDSQLLYGIFFGFFLSVILLYLLGRLLTPFFSRILVVRNAFLVPILLILCIIGGFATKKQFLQLWIALALGVLFFFMKRSHYPLAPLIIAFILGPIIEKNFRRALTLSNGSFSIFHQTACSRVILVILLAFVLYPFIRTAISFWREKRNKTGK
ncbi:MAG: tripartite tricarboxylate transporter permease [Clostridiales bacterium]|nr:tripartite tricarboxylate transporter permease [Clostridiales bacterium]